MKHRNHIDGLRAIAVLPVVLFHADFSWLPGGFVGVDVFFVISGYLISTIILKEMEEQSFSFIRFYGRRARRILPALLVVLLATLASGYFFLLPDEYTSLSEATLAAVAFLPNIYFWDNASSYFGLDIATQPLLHTWPLGIEEQFYILFPALLLTLHKRCSKTLMNQILMVLLILSLAANILLAADFTQYAFYMLPTRAWELLAGVILGIGIIPAIHGRLTANLVAVVGLVLIVGTMLLLDEHAVFPGVNAIYPVLGTVLVIHGNTRVSTAVAWLLSRQPLVLIGLISYSMYLWHWPVTVYAGMVLNTQGSRLFIVAVSILLAVLSYRFVESRYRTPTRNLTSGLVKLELSAVGAFAVFGAALIIFENGLGDRVPDDAYQAVSKGLPAEEPAHCRIFNENRLGYPGEKGDLCNIGKPGGKPQFIVWGDSHAESISHALHISALSAGVSGYSAINGGCRPLTGVYRKHKKKCLMFNNAVLDLIENTPSIQQVFLAGYWRIPLTSKGYDNSNFLIVDNESRIYSPAENRKVFRRGLHRTLERLRNRKVTIIEDIPEVGSQFGKSVANHFIRQAWLGTRGTTQFEFKRLVDIYQKEFSAITSNLPSNAELLRLSDFLCTDKICPLLIDGKLAYSDGDHLSAHGASVLAPIFKPYIEFIKDFGQKSG